MPDVQVDYAKVDLVSQRLNEVAANTVPILTNLQNQVAALLDPQGGLWLHLSSPVLKEKYTNFNTSVTQAVNSIPSWAHQFQNIKASINQLDEAIVAGSR